MKTKTKLGLMKKNVWRFMLKPKIWANKKILVFYFCFNHSWVEIISRSCCCRLNAIKAAIVSDGFKAAMEIYIKDNVENTKMRKYEALSFGDAERFHIWKFAQLKSKLLSNKPHGIWKCLVKETWEWKCGRNYDLSHEVIP